MVAGCLNGLEGSNGGGEIIRTNGIGQRIHRIPSVSWPLRNRDWRAIPDGLTHSERVQGDWI